MNFIILLLLFVPGERGEAAVVRFLVFREGSRAHSWCFCDVTLGRRLMLILKHTLIETNVVL